MFQKILLAMDASESSQAALSFTTGLALRSGAPVRVIHVNEYLAGGRGFTVETQKEARQIVQEAIDQLRASGINSSGIVTTTNYLKVAQSIVDAAEEWPADLIVMGSNRHQRFHRVLNKGLRERITRLTQLPVLTTPAALKFAHKTRVGGFENLTPRKSDGSRLAS
jgi:nucleotide-binding universal stress UspA family protein